MVKTVTIDASEVRWYDGRQILFALLILPLLLLLSLLPICYSMLLLRQFCNFLCVFKQLVGYVLITYHYY